MKAVSDGGEDRKQRDTGDLSYGGYVKLQLFFV